MSPGTTALLMQLLVVADTQLNLPHVSAHRRSRFAPDLRPWYHSLLSDSSRNVSNVSSGTSTDGVNLLSEVVALSAKTQNQELEGMAAAGDLLGLLDFIQSQRTSLIAETAMGALSKCIRQKAKSDLTGLTEDAFALILTLATNMLLRCKLQIDESLKEADRCGGSPGAIPKEIIDGGWIDLAEKVSRFVAEMAAIRGRVHHLHGLKDEGRKTARRPARPRPVDAVEPGEAETPQSKGPPDNGRLRRPASQIGRSNLMACPVS